MSKEYNHANENTRDIQIVKIELTNDDLNNPLAMEAFNEVMNAAQDAHVQHVEDVRKTLSVMHGQEISEECASDVVYLRSRSRWSEAMECELIRLHLAGTPPNVCEWP